MSHEHPHDGISFYVERLGTIAFSAALGYAGLKMALDPDKKMLNLLLVPKLHGTVLFCGIALLLLSAIALVSVIATLVAARTERTRGHAAEHEDAELLMAGATASAHAHEHGDSCCHHHDHDSTATSSEAPDEGGCCGQDDGHNHSLSTVLLRYVALLLPIALFMAGLPNKAMWLSRTVDARGIDVSDAAGPAGGAMSLDFKELDQAAYSSAKRAHYTGHIGRLVGQISHAEGNPRVFSLFRSRMTCCAADVTQIQVFIVSRDPVPIRDGTWVDVGGRIQFQYQEPPDKPGKYVPVLHMTDIKTMDPPSNPYIY